MKEKRKIRIDGQLAYVPLTKGYEAVIDANDVPLVEGYNWTASVNPWTVYAYRMRRVDGKQRPVKMHRVIMGEPEGHEVDHRDCDGLNNRRCNLRAATSSENKKNQRVSSKNTTGYKGVHYYKAYGNFQAYISANGKQNFLGYYETAEAAHAAYCAAAARVHGEFARTA
jgi:hypothetical protein